MKGTAFSFAVIGSVIVGRGKAQSSAEPMPSMASSSTPAPPASTSATDLIAQIPQCAESSLVNTAEWIDCSAEDWTCHCTHIVAIEQHATSYMANSTCSIEDVTKVMALIPQICQYYTPGGAPPAAPDVADSDADAPAEPATDSAMAPAANMTGWNGTATVTYVVPVNSTASPPANVLSYPRLSLTVKYSSCPPESATPAPAGTAEPAPAAPPAEECDGCPVPASAPGMPDNGTMAAPPPPSNSTIAPFTGAASRIGGAMDVVAALVAAALVL